MTQHRQPAGIPVGGQFAQDSKARSSVTLVDEPAGTEESLSGARRFGSTETVPERTTITPGKGRRNGQWAVAEAVTEVTDNPSGGQVSVRLGGHPHRRARNTTAAELVRAFAQPDVTDNTIRSLVDGGNPMTLLVAFPSGAVEAIEGRGYRHSDGRAMILCKGSKIHAYPIGGENGLDVVAATSGFGGQQALADTYAARLADTPEVTPVDFEGVPSYSDATDPEGNGPPSAIAAVYLYNHPGFGDDESKTTGCMFMATDYDAEDDIVNGYGWVPRGSDLVAEHSSMYGKDLKNWGGRVSGYEPGSITFADMVHSRVPEDRTEAYRAVQGQSFYDE